MSRDAARGEHPGDPGVGALFGAILGLFVSVRALFDHDRALASQAAPVLFNAFETFQYAVLVFGFIVFATLALQDRTAAAVGALGLIVVAGLLGLLSSLLVTDRLEMLRMEGLSDTEEFRRLHGWSMVIYVTQAVVLLVVAVLLVLKPQVPARRSSTSEV